MTSQDKAELRLATEADAAAVARVLAEAFAEFRPQYTDEGFQATTPPEAVIRARLAEGPTWVAVRDGAVLGTVAAVDEGERVYIRSMAVVPGERGAGVAAALLGAAERFARERGCKSLYLCTTPFLHAAIGLYERRGFRRTDEGPHDLFGTPLFTMEKRVAASE